MNARFLRMTVLLLVSLLLAGSCAGAERQLPKYAELVILHTNDMHGHLFPFEYGDEKDVGGIARRASLIDVIRWDSDWPVLVMDAGDIFTRGPIAPIYRGKPDIEAMNAIPYDIITLGNNEFKGDEGLAGQRNMFERIKQAEFPIVCANCLDKKTGKPIVPPYVIIERGGLRFGIFGLIAPRVATYPHAEGLQIDDPIETAKKLVPILKEKADVIIGLTHIGYEFDKSLAAAVPEIDIIVGGDSHTWLLKPEVVQASAERHAFWVGGPVIVQDGEWGKCLGKLDVIVRRQGEHDFQVMSLDGELLPVTSEIESSEEIEAILRRYTKPLDKVVAQCSASIPKAEMAAWSAEVYRSVGGADIGMGTTVFEAGIEQGPVTMLDLRKAFTFEDYLVTLPVPGKMIEMLAANKNVIMAGVPQPIDPGAVYRVCADDFQATQLQELKGIEAKPLGKTVHEAIAEFLGKSVP